MAIATAVAIIATVAAAPLNSDNFCTVGEVGAVEFTSPSATLDVDAQSVRLAYPDRAFRMQRAGEARFSCDVEGARPARCTITSEAPSNFGFGKATLSLLESSAVVIRASSAATLQGVARFRIADPGRDQPCPEG